MVDAGKQTVVVVGAGPRGTSVLERLLARHARGGTGELHIDLVDPYPAGPGHVWRTDQSRLYLMNTQSFFPTLIPGHAPAAPPLLGSSFDAWRRGQREDPSPELSTADKTELVGLESTGFPSRALYGRYLRWTFNRLLESLPDGVSVRVHETHARRVARHGTGFAVGLSTGGTLDADHVVLALGHLPARLNERARRLADKAKASGLNYWPPAVPNDVQWDGLPAGEKVLVRGMGLNFFDVLGQLTEGRGGRFEDTGLAPGEAVRYVKSGREPLILAASRRGTPYRAKAELDRYYPASVRLRFLSEDAVAGLRAMGATAGFDHDVWPLLHRDAIWAYYSTLVRAVPGAVSDDGFLDRLDAVLDLDAATDGLPGRSWERALAVLVDASVVPEHRLDLNGLARPLAGRSFASHAELDDAVLGYLREDAAGSARGEDDPVKMAIGALNAGRAVVKSLVADGGITEESWLGELRGWFESFVEGLASGPPALRMDQLAALVRAGVVRFIGPDPVFSVEDGQFRADSPWVKDTPWRARHLVEALAPANRVLENQSSLLEGLLADGLVRPRIMIAADGEAVTTAGLDVTAPPYRPLDANGHAVEGLFVLGLQLSAVQWGTAIAAESGPVYRSGDRTLRDADAIAAAILG
ncbi:FAD/NAD(P)-binding protein [Arthrobacter sp. 35W]|uniref:FAD/NAD(P)-binding protein n=1 Tax=Arthrobacter sp. 35W TaxID=1132441 RepID=UPI00040C68D6|nr:FAD/NAD(P)-binding protein [Arthrobacter sp. 35W]